MHKLFNIDSGFFRFMAKIADIILLNGIFLVLSFGVITIGPGLIALYYIMLKEVRDEETEVVKNFFKAFIKNFVQGVVLEIIVGGVGLFFAYDLYMVYNWNQNVDTMGSRISLYALAGVTMVIALGFIYTFPMVAKFYNNTANIIKNSIAMAISNLPSSLAVFAIWVIIGFLVKINPYNLMFAFGLATFVQSFFFVKVFDKYIPKKESVEEEDSEGEISEELGEEPVHVVLTEEDMEVKEDK